MSDEIQNQPLEIPPPPASPAEGQPVAPVDPQIPPPPPTSLLDNPILIAAATGKKKGKPNSTSFKPGNPYGRPTVMTVETMANLLRGLRTSKTVSGAIAAAGIGKTTYYRARRDNAEFAELADIAEAHATALLVAKLIKAASADRRDSKQDWRGFAWLLERRCSSRAEFAKFTPDAITHDVLANAISKVVATIMPKIKEEDRAAVLQAMESVFADLKPKDRDDSEIQV